MNIGTALIDITPAAGAHLSGFAMRTQPSLGMLDRLYLRGIYLADGSERLFWLHCDLIGLEESLVTSFRQWAASTLAMPASQVMVSATHTHSGPCTIRLAGAGEYDEQYVAFLQSQLRAAACQAMANPEPCSVVNGAAQLELAIHRRGPATAHTDPRLGVTGFTRADGSYIAVIANYAIHPVALGYENRHISADLFGAAARGASRELRGEPLVLMTNGACGNLNPPAECVDFQQLETWGGQIAQGVLRGMARAEAVPVPGLRTFSLRCPLPLDFLDERGVEAAASDVIAKAADGNSLWRDKLHFAVARWRMDLLTNMANGRAQPTREIELFAVALGRRVFLGVNAEVFSIFTEWVRFQTGLDICTVSYANGDWGYIVPRTAYAEGGYEIDEAHFFYGGNRFGIGALELLANNAAQLLRHELPASAAVNPTTA